MSEIESARRIEALEQVSQALALLEKVQIRWRRYQDTAPFANAAEPVEMILRTARNILARPASADSADMAWMFPEVIVAMRKIKRDELRPVIERTQAAYEAVLYRRL
jgi:hypothetical protein